MTFQNGEPCCVYGDATNPINRYLPIPFKGINLPAQELEFNRQISSVRKCMEWGFNKVAQLFAFLDLKKNL